MLLRTYQFRENHFGAKKTLLKEMYGIPPIPFSVSFGIEDVPKRLLCDYESPNHHRIENHALFKAVKFP